MSELWTIQLRPEGPGPDSATRIKIALKGLLRSHGLRCVGVSMAGAAAGEADGAGRPGTSARSIRCARVRGNGKGGV